MNYTNIVPLLKGVITMKYSYLLLLIILVIMSLLIGFVPIEFKSFENGEISTLVFAMLNTLFLLSILIERTLDVFLTIFRAEQSEEFNSNIHSLNKKISNKKYSTEEKQGFFKELESRKEKKLQHSMKTLRIAHFSGLAIGLFVSMAGIRTVSNFIETSSLSGAQLGVLNFLDITLTGCLLTGGSDSIHKVAEALRTFLDLSTKSAASRRDRLNG
jgi:hypothetical protein